MSNNDWSRLKEHLIEKGEITADTIFDHTKAPITVDIAPRIIDDLQALKTLLEDPTPPMRVVRSKKLKSVAVSFADASGKGVGASTIGVDSKVSILQKVTNINVKSSSNFREL